jgi:hypothetical protein
MELTASGPDVIFRLPQAVTPETVESSADVDLQNSVETVWDSTGLMQQPFTLELGFQMSDVVQQVQSSTHAQVLEVKTVGPHASVRLGGVKGLDRSGFEVALRVANLHVPRMWVEDNARQPRACMMAFYPDFDVGHTKEHRFHFVLDLSCSMQEHTLAAKQALAVALAQLPADASFNVSVFGDTEYCLRPSFIPNTAVERDQVLLQVAKLSPSMGSSNISGTLHSLGQLYRSQAAQTCLVVVSDGAYINADLAVHSARSCGLRVFTIGVGDTCQRGLLKQLCAVSGGHHVYMESKRRSTWLPLLKELVRTATEPGLSDVKVRNRFEIWMRVQGV